MTLSFVTTSAAGAVVDATVAVAISAKEAGREQRAVTELSRYSANGRQFYAPGVLSSETLYVLCGKGQSGVLTVAEYVQAVIDLENLMRGTLPPPMARRHSLALRSPFRAGTGAAGRRECLAVYESDQIVLQIMGV